MNTTKIGDQLENKAIEIIERLIEEKRIGVLKECIKIFKKKKYPSTLIGRGAVEFDLTVEVWAPNAPKYSMIYIVECKNYKNRLPITQVKKFYSDITETHGVNAKGIIISTSPLQKGALEFADSKGIMIIEGESKDNFKITLYRNSNRKIFPFIEDKINSELLTEGVVQIGKVIESQIANALLESKNTNISTLSKVSITNLAKLELDKIDKSILENAYGLDKDKLINYLRTEYDVAVTYFNPNQNNYLGVCKIAENEIGINKSIVNTKREMFVLAHEFGHYLLHNNIKINQIILDSFSDPEFNFSTGTHSLKNAKNWIEWQANYFSISLLVPQSSIMARQWRYMITRNIPKGKYILNDSIQTQKIFKDIVTYLSQIFNVSKTSIIYRMKEFKLVEEAYSTKLIKEIIEELKEELFI